MSQPYHFFFYTIFEVRSVRVYDVETDDDEVLMWWEQYEHDNTAAKGKATAAKGKPAAAASQGGNPFWQCIVCVTIISFL